MSAIPHQFRIGLATSRTHQDAPNSVLARLLNGSRSAIEQHLQPQLIVVGRTLDAMDHLGLLKSYPCLLYTSPSPRDLSTSRMPSSA